MRGERTPRGLKARFVDSDPAVEAALAAGLRYVSDMQPGIRRKRQGDGFVYIGTNNQPVVDERVLARITSLAIPPAWTNVWICATSRGHIQVTGYDAKGRKQYRYHPHWREVRDANKYERMIDFAQALPHLRARVSDDLRLPGLPCQKVLATVVRLLDETDIRVGNQEYVRENASFGLTTLEQQHAEVARSRLRFSFRGKSGKEQTVVVEDRRVAKIVRNCQELPGAARA
jgi:DNA topoisomerase-1